MAEILILARIEDREQTLVRRAGASSAILFNNIIKIVVWRKSRRVRQVECKTKVEFIQNFNQETGSNRTCGKTRSRWVDMIKIV
jgi:hypothetical protein